MSITSAQLIGYLNPTKMEPSILWPVYQSAQGEGTCLQTCDEHLIITGFTSININVDELIRASDPVWREVGQKGLLSVLLKPGYLFVGDPRELLAAREALINALPKKSGLVSELLHFSDPDETDIQTSLSVSKQHVAPNDELKLMIARVISTSLGESGVSEEFLFDDFNRNLKVRWEAIVLRMPVSDYLRADPNVLNNCENSVSAYCRNWGLNSFVILPDLSDDLQAVFSRFNLVQRLGDLRCHRHARTTKGALTLSVTMELAFVCIDLLAQNNTLSIEPEWMTAYAQRRKHQFPAHRQVVDLGLNLYLSEWHKVLNFPERSSVSDFSPLSQTGVQFDCLRRLGDTARSWEKIVATEEIEVVDASEQVRRIYANA